jgi:hypothetical protein
MLVPLAIALVPTVALGAGAGKGKVETTMSGAAETPKGPTAGSGKAELTIAGRRVCWELKIGGIGTPVAAHVHRGRSGIAGPVVVPLGAKYARKGCTTTTLVIANALLARPSVYYVNVHTAKYPAGAVRGQLKTARGGGQEDTPTSTVEDSPTPTDTTGGSYGGSGSDDGGLGGYN